MLRRPQQLVRLLHIQWVLLRHGLDEIVLATHLFRPVRFLRYCSPWFWLNHGRERPPRGVRIRLALEDLGPIFVKFGQMLSTRRDLLPDDIAAELARLQDRVPPFPSAQSRVLVERAFNQPLEQLFSRFDTDPLASASIAQVHGAQLRDGREVVVKVVRPGIERVIRRDVDLLHFIAGNAERFWREGRRLRPREVVHEYEKTIFDELDLVREAANGSQLRRNFDGSALLYVPEIHWPLTRRTVMVMERINGIPISDLATLRQRGVNMKRLSERGVEIFFTQVFRHSFFHADMHPGNIFVDATDPQNPRYIAIDFGIIGTLAPTDQHYLAENFVAFFRRDYRRVAELHIESGWVPASTRVDEFESAIRTVCEPIFDRPLKDISFGGFLLSLFQTARRFNMEVQPQLVLLQKTLLNIEGLGRQLDPDLDLWKTAKPILEEWMTERIGPKAMANKLRDNAPRWAEHFPDLPDLVQKLLKHAASGEVSVRLDPAQLAQVRQQLAANQHRQSLSIFALGLGLAAVAVALLAHDVPSGPMGIPLAAWGLGIAAVLTGARGLAGR